MESALRLELQQLEGLPFIAGVIWAALIGISLLAIVFFYFLKLRNKSKQEEVTKQAKKSKVQGF